MIMYYFRVTKYDKSYRDQWGQYQREEWTGPEHIGQEIGGHRLTQAEFDQTVRRYQDAVRAFARESAVTELTVRDPRSAAGPGWESLRDGDTVPIGTAVDAVGAMLAGTLARAELETEFQFFVHIGWDMYMYIGSHTDCADAVVEAERMGLFVDQDFVSPYLPDLDQA